MRKPKIKTLDIHAKEWRDKVNGNSYFNVRVTINFGLKGEETIGGGFGLQYGYGDHYLTRAMKLLKEQNKIKTDDQTPLWRYCEENKIILRHSKESNCKQKEVKEFGQL